MEDVEQLKREVAELKAALQGKAGVNESNSFTDRQHIDVGNQAVENVHHASGLHISSTPNVAASRPGISFTNSGVNDGTIFYDLDNRFKIKSGSDADVRLLDSRDAISFNNRVQDLNNGIVTVIGNENANAATRNILRCGGLLLVQLRANLLTNLEAGNSYTICKFSFPGYAELLGAIADNVPIGYKNSSIIAYPTIRQTVGNSIDFLVVFIVNA